MIVVQYLHLRKSMNVILTFYRNFVSIASFVTILGCYLVWFSGSWTSITVVFWAKLCTNIVMGLFIYIFNPDQFTFFHNLGFSKFRLFTFTFLIDMFIWGMLSFFTIRLLL
jgi:hypothetical protein